jgi:RNA-directed DNA polymerase
MIGKEYQFPTQRCKSIGNDKKRLRNNGITPKHLIRYADDWVILTTKEEEAIRLLKRLQKYFKAKLKVELSEEKTVITNTTKKPMEFLGFNIIAEKPRVTPNRPGPKDIVGKAYPNPKRVNKQIAKITQEIRRLKTIPNDMKRAIQIEKINSMITGVAEYWKTSICGKVFSRIDNNVDSCAYTVFRKIYNEDVRWHKYPLKELSNRPQRHKDYDSKVFGVEVDGMKIGITKTFITHSQWEKYPFNQKMTPYTAVGRELYERQKNKKSQPLNRPPLYTESDLQIAESKDSVYNFEYYMNREYAFNRDRGKCRICKTYLNQGNRICHHKDNTLSLNQINKVSNLVWKCKNCR